MALELKRLKESDDFYGNDLTDRHRCEVCLVGFATVQQSDSHNTAFHQPGQPIHYECSICRSAFDRISSFLKHSCQPDCSKSRKTLCTACVCLFCGCVCTRSAVSQHIESDHVGDLENDLCSVGLLVRCQVEDPRSCADHQFDCPFCDKRHMQLLEAVYHTVVLHPAVITIIRPRNTPYNTPYIRCTICEEFVEEIMVDAHILEVHVHGQKKKKCRTPGSSCSGPTIANLPVTETAVTEKQSKRRGRPKHIVVNTSNNSKKSSKNNGSHKRDESTKPRVVARRKISSLIEPESHPDARFTMDRDWLNVKVNVQQTDMDVADSNLIHNHTSTMYDKKTRKRIASSDNKPSPKRKPSSNSQQEEIQPKTPEVERKVSTSEFYCSACECECDSLSDLHEHILMFACCSDIFKIVCPICAQAVMNWQMWHHLFHADQHLPMGSESTQATLIVGGDDWDGTTGGQPKFACLTCPIRFRSARYQRLHMAMMHTQQVDVPRSNVAEVSDPPSTANEDEAVVATETQSTTTSTVVPSIEMTPIPPSPSPPPATTGATKITVASTTPPKTNENSNPSQLSVAGAKHNHSAKKRLLEMAQKPVWTKKSNARNDKSEFKAVKVVKRMKKKLPSLDEWIPGFSALGNTIESNLGEVTYECELCTAPFYSALSKRLHTSLIHNHQPNKTCDRMHLSRHTTGSWLTLLTVGETQFSSTSKKTKHVEQSACKNVESATVYPSRGINAATVYPSRSVIMHDVERVFSPSESCSPPNPTATTKPTVIKLDDDDDVTIIKSVNNSHHFRNNNMNNNHYRYYNNTSCPFECSPTTSNVASRNVTPEADSFGDGQCSRTRQVAGHYYRNPHVHKNLIAPFYGESVTRRAEELAKSNETYPPTTAFIQTVMHSGKQSPYTITAPQPSRTVMPDGQSPVTRTINATDHERAHAFYAAVHQRKLTDNELDSRSNKASFTGRKPDEPQPTDRTMYRMGYADDEDDDDGDDDDDGLSTMAQVGDVTPRVVNYMTVRQPAKSDSLPSIRVQPRVIRRQTSFAVRKAPPPIQTGPFSAVSQAQRLGFPQGAIGALKPMVVKGMASLKGTNRVHLSANRRATIISQTRTVPSMVTSRVNVPRYRQQVAPTGNIWNDRRDPAVPSPIVSSVVSSSLPSNNANALRQRAGQLQRQRPIFQQRVPQVQEPRPNPGRITSVALSSPQQRLRFGPPSLSIKPAFQPTTSSESGGSMDALLMAVDQEYQVINRVQQHHQTVQIDQAFQQETEVIRLPDRYETTSKPVFAIPRSMPTLLRAPTSPRQSGFPRPQ